MSGVGRRHCDFFLKYGRRPTLNNFVDPVNHACPACPVKREACLSGVESFLVFIQLGSKNIPDLLDDFLFELSKSEFANWRSQFATSNDTKPKKIGFLKEEQANYINKR